MLVALIAASQAAVEPEAGLDRPGADEMVALLGEDLLRLNAIHMPCKGGRLG
jgi:hypothetical protein